LSDLSLKDPFIECLRGQIGFCIEPCVVETSSDFGSIVVERVCNRKNNHLSRRNPKWPKVSTGTAKRTRDKGI
jgi:hypothetical protein